MLAPEAGWRLCVKRKDYVFSVLVVGTGQLILGFKKPVKIRL